MFIQVELNQIESDWFKKISEAEDRSCVKTAKRMILERMPKDYKIGTEAKIIYANKDEDPRFIALYQESLKIADEGERMKIYAKMEEIEKEYNERNKKK